MLSHRNEWAQFADFTPLPQITGDMPRHRLYHYSLKNVKFHSNLGLIEGSYSRYMTQQQELFQRFSHPDKVYKIACSCAQKLDQWEASAQKELSKPIQDDYYLQELGVAEWDIGRPLPPRSEYLELRCLAMEAFLLSDRLLYMASWNDDRWEETQADYQSASLGAILHPSNAYHHHNSESQGYSTVDIARMVKDFRNTLYPPQGLPPLVKEDQPSNPNNQNLKGQLMKLGDVSSAPGSHRFATNASNAACGLLYWEEVRCNIIH